MRRASALALRARLCPLATGIALCLGISIGISGLARWQASRIRAASETLERLGREIEAREGELRRLEERTWGIALHEAENGKYVVLPPFN